jgi:hypothetical protein
MPDDKDPDSTPTPAQTPDAKRRSSQTLPAVVKCPACMGDVRIDCAYCFNELVGGSTRYVSQEKALAYKPPR